MINEESVYVERIKQGDENAFRILFCLYSKKLCLWSFRITGDRAIAEDIVQDFFIKLWQKRSDLHYKPSFSAYAYRAVLNASLNFLRDNRRVRFTDQFDVFENLHPENNAETDEEQHKRLFQAIDELPEKRRKIFIMAVLEKRKYAEVAVELGISKHTVRVQVSKAYHFLRARMAASVFICLINLLLKK